jgi:hypothetical protein
MHYSIEPGMCLQQVSEAVNLRHFAPSAAFSPWRLIKINMNQTSFFAAISLFYLEYGLYFPSIHVHPN